MSEIPEKNRAIVGVVIIALQGEKFAVKKKKSPSLVFDIKTVKMQDFRCLADIIQSTMSPKNYYYILISIN